MAAADFSDLRANPVVASAVELDAGKGGGDGGVLLLGGVGDVDFGTASPVVAPAPAPAPKVVLDEVPADAG